jgi:hypothetical protein
MYNYRLNNKLDKLGPLLFININKYVVYNCRMIDTFKDRVEPNYLLHTIKYAINLDGYLFPIWIVLFIA